MTNPELETLVSKVSSRIKTSPSKLALNRAWEMSKDDLVKIKVIDNEQYNELINMMREELRKLRK